METSSEALETAILDTRTDLRGIELLVSQFSQQKKTTK
jgi:hypothetical protein